MLQKFADAVAQRKINRFRLHGQRCRRTAWLDDVALRIPCKFQQRFVVHGCGGDEGAVAIVGGGAAVIGEDVLAVVLDADVVAIDERYACLPRLGAEETVALFILAERIGGAGQVAEQHSAVVGERLRHVEVIVFCPAVLAEHQADAQRFAAEGELQGLQRAADAGVFLGAELLQAVEMAAVVELAVVGQGVFDDEASALIAADEPAVMAGEGCIVFAHASVLVELACFDGNAAEHDADVLAVQCDLLRIIFAVIKKALLLPKVTYEIAGQRHLGQQQDVRFAAARFVYSLYDFMIV